MTRELLQQALDALRQCEFTSPPAQRPIVKDAITALRSALAAPMPEPVAWLVEGWHDGKLIAHIPHLTLEDAKASAAVFSQHYTTTKLVPLYAAPPAAPAPVVREPLSAEQIRDVCVDVHLKRDFTTNLEKFIAIARAIEQAHGIGGGGK